MKKLTKCFTVAAAMMVATTAWAADPVTEGFDGFTAKWNTEWTVWELNLPEGWNYSGTANTFDANTDFYKTKAPSVAVSATNTDTYLITPELQGDFSFWMRNQTKTYQAKVTAYECTYADGTLTLGRQIGTKTLAKTASGTPAWEQVSFSTQSAVRVALLLSRAYMDDFTYTAPEVVEGAALEVYDGMTKVGYNYNIDFGVTTAGATKTFTLKNPGTASLDVTLTADGGFTLDKEAVTIAAGSRQDIVVAMPDVADADGSIVIRPADASVETFTLHVSGQIIPVMSVTMGETVVENGFADKFGKVSADAVHTFTVANQGTAALSATVGSDNAEFVVAPTALEVAPGEAADFTVTFKYDAANVGARNGKITITPADTKHVAVLAFTATANVADPDVWSENFEGAGLPEGWEAGEKGWTIADGVAHGKYIYGTTDYLTTPALEVAQGETLDFQYKGTANYTDVKIQASKDGGDFKDLTSFSVDKMDAFETYTIDGLEPGTYKFRFVNDAYDLDNFQGLKLAALEHDMDIVSFDIPTTGATEEDYVATVTVQEKAGSEEPVWAKLFIDGREVAQANKLVAAGAEETFELKFIPTQAYEYKKAYIEVYNTQRDFDKKTDEVTVNIVKVSILKLSELTGYTFNTEQTEKYDRVKLDYTVNAGWNTIALPFTISDFSVFGEGAKAYEFSGYDNGNLRFTKVSQPKMATPYVFYVETPVEGKVVFKDVTIYASVADEAQCAVKQGEATFQGTYSRMLAGELEGKYGVTRQATIAKGGAGAKMAAFRAYFNLPASVTNARLVISEEEAQGIEAVKEVELKQSVYNLNGQKVSNARGGLYIVNGKKVYVK